LARKCLQSNTISAILSNTKSLTHLFMSETFKKKSDAVKKVFSSLGSPEERYQMLIDMGRKLPPFPPSLKTSENLVPGCQSLLYLSAHMMDGRMYFEAASDALISAGLTALLISAYDGEPPDLVLKSPPDFLREIGIFGTLSPSRSNGLSQIHLSMKKLALKFLVVAL